MLVQYEKDILKSTNYEACLTILARGLRCSETILALLKLYSNRNSFVFVLNMNELETEYFTRQDLPYFCNVTGLTVGQRSARYQDGGIFYGSSTVLVTDFVNRKAQIDKISCLIVLNAETIVHDSSIAFICYLFREHNSLGLIKAFTSDAIRVNSCGIEEIARLFCLNKLLFYPRFHEIVKLSLPEISARQVYLKRNEPMGEAEMLIEDLIKKIYIDKNKGAGGFDYAKMLILKQEHAEISCFKKLISLMFNSSSLTTLLYYQAMVDAQRANTSGCMWVLDESSHLLQDILKGMLEDDIKRSNQTPELFIYDMASNTFRLGAAPVKRIRTADEAPVAEEVVSHNDDAVDSNMNGLSDILSSASLAGFYSVNPKIKHIIEILKTNDSLKTVILCQNRTVKRYMESVLTSLSATLACTHPIVLLTHLEFVHTDTYDYELIIMLNPDLGSIRGVECLAAKGIKPTTYILQYKNTTEEQRFLEEIREEKSAFESIIGARARLPLRLELERIEMPDNPEDRSHRVVVDSREMRSRLPFFLYKAGNEVEVKVLEIGDYLLENGRCIERKSIDDFLTSLNSGRLYQQTQRLVYTYISPILLLEFNDVKPVLGDFDVVENFRNSYIARFCLFLYSFPQLQVIWSNSPIATVRIIRDAQLKAQEGDKMAEGCDPSVVETLLCIPGINSFNVNRVYKEFSNLYDLGMSSKERLERILDSGSAAKVYEFFTKKLQV